MTSHRRHRHSLSAYMDGELKASQVRRLEGHLAECGECRLELQNLEKLRGVLRQGLQDVRPEVAPFLWPGVRARIEGGRPDGLVKTWLRQIWEVAWERPRLSFAGAAVAGCLLLSAGYLLWEGPVGKSPGPTVSLESGQAEVVVEAVDPEPGYRAMVLTTSGRGLKVIWVVAQGET
ncbi:MAG: anti-sigma factor [candidate division NC10 bacterium]